MGLSIAMAAALLALVCASASAAPIPARNGQIHACYKVRGKAKGAMRVVAGKHCRRGERRLAWSVVGPTGATGATGASGQGGQGGAGGQGGSGAGTAGTNGNNGASGNDGNNGGNGSDGSDGTALASLETKVAALSLEVTALEDLLAGVGVGDLSGALAKLDGITGTQLDEAVGSVPVVSSLGTTVSGLGTTVSGLGTTVSGLTSKTNSLCTQAAKVPGQIDAVGAVLNSLLGGLTAIPLVGNVLGGEVAPSTPTYTCPS